MDEPERPPCLSGAQCRAAIIRVVFVGHLAVALAAKPAAPRVSLGVLIGAAFALDLLWPLFLLAGIERVEVQPGATAFTPLNFVSYPWSHSLLMAAVWGVLLVVVTRAASWTAAWVIGALVVSHWILDLITHVPDLPAWPGGPELGLGLWNSVPATFAVEGALFAGAIAVYSRFTTPRDATGRSSLWALVVVCTVIWASGPFSPPPPGAGAIAVVALAMWLFPLWGHWIEQHRSGGRTAQSHVRGA